MKVLYIIESLGSGGKERRLLSLMRGMRAYDVEMKLILLSDKIHYKEINDLGVEILLLPRNAKKDVKIFQKFIQILNTFKPDMVHCWDNIAALHFAPICYLKRIPFINSSITTAPPRLSYFSKTYLSYVPSFPFSTVILTNSLAGLYSYRVSKNKGRCIYNGFEMDRIKVRKSKGDVMKEFSIDTKYIVGMTASFSDKKDYETLIVAAEAVLKKRRDVTFVMVGDGPDRQRIENLIISKDYFRFLGRQSDVESIVSIFDIGILSTYTEGISNAIIEYMALSKPVIATDGGGTKELVIDGQTGFLVPPKSPDTLKEKIENLLSDNELRVQMGTKGYERIKEEFSINKMIDKTFELYKTQLNKK
ncbi:MAG: glycosyltransferase [Flavobacteriaceae bacterium]|jgi:glycosyltransferase involved in cell wall biosynthesis